MPAKGEFDNAMSDNAIPDNAISDKVCKCGHAHEAHTHYRRGTDCAICGADVCSVFSAARSRAARSGETTEPAPARATSEG